MKKFVLFIVFWLLLYFGMLCSADVVLDLSKNPGRIEPIQVSMDIDRIMMVNFIPACRDKYMIKIEVLKFVPKPLSLPTGFTVKRDSCSELVLAINEFIDVNQPNPDVEWEKGEKLIVGKYEKIRTELDKKLCENDDKKKRALEILDMQKYTIGGPFVMKEGDEIMVTITRGSYTWAYSISRPHGEWFVSYGFSFISPIIYKPDKFFITADPEGEQTFLLKKSPREVKPYDLEFVPSVFFWWMPAKARKLNIAPTAGLGFDTQSPVVFAGAALIYNYNIGVNFGVVFHKLNFLKDKYMDGADTKDFPEEGTSIKENLSDDQLYDSKYRFNLFLSVTFRFGSNPFKSGEK